MQVFQFSSQENSLNFHFEKPARRKYDLINNLTYSLRKSNYDLRCLEIIADKKRVYEPSTTLNHGATSSRKPM